MQYGAKAAIVGRKEERLRDVAKLLSDQTGSSCLATPADVREPPAVERAIDETLSRHGRLDIVVNAAAGNFLAPAAALSYNGFKTVMEIDAQGTYNVCKAAFEKVLREHGGNVINISATLHYGATPMQVHACAAKAAVDALTRALALEWGGLGIRVNGIAPGPIADTEGFRRLVAAGAKEKLERLIPIGRFGRIDEIASIAVFLASDVSSLIHGAMIVADGGAWLARGGSALLAED
jgi:peroxisomal 2,4-dienoyl-CoA reductase